MSKKKITAPLSYDPGKGRPKEYLAYLNWQEMEALKRLNGNNVERGPKGLPSFPPDWSGSKNTAGNWKGAPSGGGSVASTSGGGSDSGSRGLSSSSAPNAAAANAAAKQQAADTAAKQATETKNASTAARNSALAQDARKAGVGSINVGPMQTPVRIGSGNISQAVSRAAQSPASYSTVSPTMPGGGGMGRYNARRGSSVLAAGPSSGYEASGNIAKGSLMGADPSAARKYDSLEADLTRRALFSKAPPATRPPASYPSAPSGVFGPRYSQDRTYYPDAPVGATIGPRRYSTPSLAESNGYVSEFDGIGGLTDRAVTEAIKNRAYDAYKAISGYFSGPSLGYVSDIGDLPQMKISQPDVVNAQSRRVVGGLGMASLPGGPTTKFFSTTPAYGTELRDLAYGGGPTPGFADSQATAQTRGVETPADTEIDLRVGPNYVAGQGYVENMGRMGPFNTTHDLGRERIISVENFPDTYQGAAESDIADVEEQYRQSPGIYSSSSIIREQDLPYPTNPDGTPVTAEDIANLPYSVQSEIFDKARFRRMTDAEYGLTPEQKQRLTAVKIMTAPVQGNIVVNALMKGIGGIAGVAQKLPGGVGNAASNIKRGMESLDDPAEALADYMRLDPLQKAEFAKRAGKKPTTYGTGTTTAGGIPTQEPGGKGNDVGRYTSYQTASAPSYSGPVETQDTGRPAQYYLWDLGVGIPSPGDPEYNDYQEYLKIRGTA